jgi:hypothetical protein
MTNDHMLDRVIAHLRVHVAELRRLERCRADPRELEERRLVIARLQNQLARVVRDVIRAEPAPADRAAARPPGARRPRRPLRPAHYDSSEQPRGDRQALAAPPLVIPEA